MSPAWNPFSLSFWLVSEPWCLFSVVSCFGRLWGLESPQNKYFWLPVLQNIDFDKANMIFAQKSKRIDTNVQQN